MKVAFIVRSTIYKVPGGITVHVSETANHLRELGVNVTIFLTHEKINYSEFDIFHVFDITRPANILFHINKTNKPFVLSPILIDYSEYDRQHRKGLSGFVFRLFTPGANEYIKAVSRWILRKDSLQSKNYIWKGHQKSVRTILQKVKLVLPNSRQEYDQLEKKYPFNKPYKIIPNGINEKIFIPDNSAVKDELMVVCAARFEGIKNQLNLVRALRNTKFSVLLIGGPTPNQKSYYYQCIQSAGDNIKFISGVTQDELVKYYRAAKVHILPSWFETCGLSSLEAAAMGCNIVIADKGFVRDYFGDDAFYCDPGNTESIYRAVCKAAEAPSQKQLQKKVLKNYTWHTAAGLTLESYRDVLTNN